MLKLLFFIFFIITSCSHYKKVDLQKGTKKDDFEAFGKKYMISTQGKFATAAGIAMFEKGGNAIDAAAAVSFVISVERPQSTGLGGGGFMLYAHPKIQDPIAIDFREKAPLRAHKKMFLDNKDKVIPRKSLDGIFAAGVPGMVAGILEIHKKFGKLPLTDILRPAIELAKSGFPVYPGLAKALKLREKILAKYPASKKIFFKNEAPLKEGDILIQKDLAKTLERISQKGRDGFYGGVTGHAIVKENQKRKGLITVRDLKKYNVIFRRPVMGTYKDYTIYSMGPPSSGGVHVLQILNILENDHLKKWGPQHPHTIHLTSSAMQMAFADRAKYLGDQDFVTVPVQGLIGKKYAAKIRKKILDHQALKNVVAGNPFPYESDETTHFTIMDSDGHTVTSTQTINGYFGSGLVVPGTGIILNNEMDDFATKVGEKNLFGAIGGDKNLVQAEKRPLSSMSPTIIFKGKTPLLALGTPSGTRILTCVAQTILNYIEHELPLYESVSLARYHHQWSPDEIRVGEVGLPATTLSALKKMGHKIRFKNLGCKIQAIANEKGILHGVSDPRGQGSSRGDKE